MGDIKKFDLFDKGFKLNGKFFSTYDSIYMIGFIALNLLLFPLKQPANCFNGKSNKFNVIKHIICYHKLKRTFHLI